VLGVDYVFDYEDLSTKLNPTILLRSASLGFCNLLVSIVPLPHLVSSHLPSLLSHHYTMPSIPSKIDKIHHSSQKITNQAKQS